MATSLEDLALGRVTPSSSQYCLHCGEEFRKVTVGKSHLTGCVSCWRKSNFAGNPPATAAPYGAFAAQGLWDAVERAERGRPLLHRDFSTDSIYSIPDPSCCSKSPRPPKRSKASKESTSLLESHLPVPRSAGRDRVQSPLPVTPDPPHSASKEFRHSASREFPGRKRPTKLQMPLWSGATDLLSPVATPARSPVATPLRSCRPNTGEFPPDSRQSLPPRSPNSSKGSRHFLPAAVNASMPDLRPSSGPAPLVALLRVVSTPSQQARRKRPQHHESMGHAEPGLPTQSTTGSAVFGLGHEDTLPPLSGLSPRSVTSTGSLADERMQSVIRKLCQRRHVRDAMDALASSIDHEKLALGKGFRMVDGSGGFQISKIEMQKGLRKLGVTVPAMELDAVLRSFDSDGSGTIEFAEFVDAVKRWNKSSKHKDDGEVQGFLQEPQAVESICGFEMGTRVRSLVNSGNYCEVREEGTVIGHGVSSGTIAVRFETSGQVLSVKPNMIALARLSSAKRQQSLPNFDSKTSL